MPRNCSRPALVPELYVRDIKTSLAFYTEVLGFRTEYARLEEKFACLSRGDARIMLEQPAYFDQAYAVEIEQGRWIPSTLTPPFGRGINFEIFAEDYDQLLISARASGVEFLVEPQDKQHQIGVDTVHVQPAQTQSMMEIAGF